MICIDCDRPVEQEGMKRCEVCQYNYEMILAEMHSLLCMETPGETETIGIGECVMCGKRRELEDDGVCHRCSWITTEALLQEAFK